eukprot:g6715.t1
MIARAERAQSLSTRNRKSRKKPRPQDTEGQCLLGSATSHVLVPLKLHEVQDRKHVQQLWSLDVLGGTEVQQLLLRPLWSFFGDQIGRSTTINTPRVPSGWEVVYVYDTQSNLRRSDWLMYTQQHVRRCWSILRI